MRELSLFTGAGGGLLGTHLLGWRPVGYVEWDDYCQRVIAARIADGILPSAPIFGDIRAFLGDGYAASYSGLVDVISGGFPCQPFSLAGKRAGADDHRNMWPATIECIRVVRPHYAFLENVPGLLTSGYFGTILGDLAESGYDARWRILSAAEMGAPHRRDRLWIVAHTAGLGGTQQPGILDGEALERASTGAGGRVKYGHPAAGIPFDRRVAASSATPVAHADQFKWRTMPERGTGKCFEIAHGLNGRQWATEPDVGRVANGVASRVDRLKALGNGQVPAVAAAAWRLLTAEIRRREAEGRNGSSS